MREEDIYRWRGDAQQKRDYPYVMDETDIAAFNAYAQNRGFLPPQRPDGFLDDAEGASWGRWRDRVGSN